MSPITYQVFIDWDNDGGFDVGTFETGTDGWTAGGTVPPTLTQSTVRSYTGTASLLITWATGGSLPLAQKTITGLTAGTSYTATAYVYVPSGSPDVLLVIAGDGLGANVTTKDQWALATLTFTAASSTHSLQLWPATSPTAGQQCWIDTVRVIGPGEDVTTRTLHRTGIALQYGRDQARSLSPIAPGQASFSLDNDSDDYSPDNSSSPLYGHLQPGRNVRIYATHNGIAYSLFYGSLEDYEIDPSLSSRSVKLTGIDSLGQLSTVQISTGLYRAVRTGDAINYILDAAGWTAARDIDSGATVYAWWWREGSTALDSIKAVLTAEGPGSIAYIGADGTFVYRDRHHRYIRPASSTVQATWDSLIEPAIDQSIGYEVGWRDIVNEVAVSVTEQVLSSSRSIVYEDQVTRQLATGETLIVRAVANSPFQDAATPTAGTDFTVRSGAVTVALSRTSGLVTEIRLTATSAAQLEGLRLRAYALNPYRTVRIESRDLESIAKYKVRSLNYSAELIGVNDAQAIADLIVATRKDRLPIVTVKMVAANDTRIAQMLQRDLSDRVRLTIPEASVDADFHIERISHRITADRHETTFGCERVVPDIPGVFVLDVSLLDTGVVGQFGYIIPSELFVLDSATQGVLGTNLIGY